MTTRYAIVDKAGRPHPETKPEGYDTMFRASIAYVDLMLAPTNWTIQPVKGEDDDGR